MISKRLASQMDFLIEIEKLKAVYRQNTVYDNSRHENSAEHSWHLALMAVVLAGEAVDPDVDLLRVVEMVLIHDIVEIDAGDTFLYDAAGHLDKGEREGRAADRIFGLLPEDQRDRFLSLWREFEKRDTATARFAAALDNMQPVINHFVSDGCGIRGHQLTVRQVIEKKAFIGDVSPSLWEYTRETIAKSERAGFYAPERQG